jgi:hypothetical protein
LDLLPRTPTDQEVLGVVERWVQDLVDLRYETAFSRTAHDPYYQWTPELIRQVIEGYGSPEPHPAGPFVVTSPAEAQGRDRQRIAVGRNTGRPSILAHVSYNLPLNGQMSDLTATFRVEQRGDHGVLVLEEIHVF